MSREVDWASVESEVRNLVDARIEANDDKLVIENPTDEELKQLFEYTQDSNSIRGCPVPSEERLVLKPSGSSSAEPYAEYEGVSIDEYGELEIEHESHTTNLVASLSQDQTSTSIYRSGDEAIAVTDDINSGVSVHNLSDTPIEAVVEYYWQFDRWTLDYQDRHLDLRDESEVTGHRDSHTTGGDGDA